MRRETIGTAVIGGSQSGLAVGYHLRRLGERFVILEAQERVGDAWRKRWDSLRLFTPNRFNRLPGSRFPGPPSDYPSKDQVAHYLESYARQFDLPVRTGIRVESVRWAGTGFEVSWGDDVLFAERVVVATGACDSPRIPPFAQELDGRIDQIHSKSYRDPGQVADGSVLVVGAGNSGAEIALELSRYHRVWLAGRDTGQEPTRAGTAADRLFTPLMWLLATRLLTVRTPPGRRFRSHFLQPPRGIPLGRVRRNDLKRAGVERVPRVAGVKNGLPLLADGSVIEPTTLIWCTGFEPAFDWIEIPLFDEYGFPEHDRGVVRECPGLYFVGLPFQYSLSSALLGGVGRDARFVAERIARSREPLPLPRPATGVGV